MIRRPPRSTLDRSSAASDVYKRQGYARPGWPSDGPEGRVIFAGETGAPTISLGGSIYFKVYERTGNDPDDPYGLGLSLIHISEPTRPY